MKLNKKRVAATLAAAMVLTQIPAAALAEDVVETIGG